MTSMKRLGLALLISIVGIVFSWVVLRPKEHQSDSVSTRQSIAKIISIQNDVSRQEEGRLLWSPIRVGDKIFVGDKIKTSGLSSTIIELDESSSRVEIEENSIVAMNKGAKPSLNMLEGRVFIKQDDGTGSGLDLLSGGKKIDLKGNSAISVSQDGTSRIESFSDGKNLFTDLQPEYSATLLSSKNEIELNWKPFSLATPVEVFIGESPVLMKKDEKNGGALNGGKVQVPMKVGVNYWQLVSSVDGKEIRSPLMKLNLLRPQAPTPIFPSALEVIRTGDGSFDFKWIKGNTGESVVVEVAKDEAFKNIVISSEVKDQTFFTPTSQLPTGSYFWKVKSPLSGKDWVESSITPFTVHQGSGLISPTPIAPRENALFYIKKNTPQKIRFEWRKQNEVSGYEVKVRGQGIEKIIQSTDNLTDFSISKLGKYSWEVSSIDPNGKKSILPVKRDFEVKASGSIAWNMTQKKFLYLSNLPIVILRWQKTPGRTSVLKVSQRPDFADSEVFQVRENDFPYRAIKDGLYFAQVSSLNEDEEVEAESPIYDFEVVEAPLPPAPLLKGNPTQLLATAQGNLQSQLTNMKAEWLAIAQIRDPKGKVVDERRFSDESVSFSGMLPGKYLLLVKFFDEYKRMSEVSTFQMEVPEKSKVPAPKIKGIKVR